MVFQYKLGVIMHKLVSISLIVSIIPHNMFYFTTVQPENIDFFVKKGGGWILGRAEKPPPANNETPDRTAAT